MTWWGSCHLGPRPQETATPPMGGTLLNPVRSDLSSDFRTIRATCRCVFDKQPAACYYFGSLPSCRRNINRFALSGEVHPHAHVDDKKAHACSTTCHGQGSGMRIAAELQRNSPPAGCACVACAARSEPKDDESTWWTPPWREAPRSQRGVRATYACVFSIHNNTIMYTYHGVTCYQERLTNHIIRPHMLCM